MTSTSPERPEQARMALREIVADYGPSALSDPAMMSNLLKDFLPDSPSAAKIIVAAAEERLADSLSEHVSQGMDVGTATRLISSAFASRTLYKPDVCGWVVGEFAVALGLARDADVRAAGAGTPGAAGAAGMAAGGQPGTPGLQGVTNPSAGAPVGAGAAAGGGQPGQAAWDPPTVGPTHLGGEAVTPLFSPGQGAPPGYPPGTGPGFGGGPGYGQGPGAGLAGQQAGGYIAGGGYAQPPAPATPNRRMWIIFGAAAAVVVVVAALLVFKPWSTTAVLQPTGLTTASATSSSIRLSWSPPASGPQPSKYLILEDGQQIGSVPGSVTSYQATGLAPDSSYQFQVEAVRGSKDSPRSTVATADTTTPPVPDALLTGQWTAYYKVLRWSPLDTTYKVGNTWSDGWRFTPNCSSGPCSVTLDGSVNNHSFTTVMTPSGGAYVGSVTLTDFEYCDYASVGTTYPIADHMTFRIVINKAAVSNQTWTATSFVGTMVMQSPYTLAGSQHCNAFTAKTSIRGAP